MTSLQKYFYTAVSKPSFKEKQTNKGLVINPLWLTGFIVGESFMAYRFIVGEGSDFFFLV